MEFAEAIERAEVRTFRVPNVGKVRVEIGDEVTREVEYGRYAHGHTYPAYRVSVNDAVIMFGVDWGVPVHACIDDMDAMLSLLGWVEHEVEGQDVEFDAEYLDLWVRDRCELRDALSAPGAGHWRDVMAEFKAERGW